MINDFAVVLKLPIKNRLQNLNPIADAREVRASLNGIYGNPALDSEHKRNLGRRWNEPADISVTLGVNL